MRGMVPPEKNPGTGKLQMPNPKGSNGGGGMPKGHVTQKKREKLEQQRIDAAVEEALQAQAERDRARVKQAKDVLSDGMNYFFGLAARHQPTDGNPHADAKKFEGYLEKAMDAASKLAPYQHRRLASLQVTEVPMDLSRLTDAELDALERLQRKATDAGGDSGRAGATLQ